MNFPFVFLELLLCAVGRAQCAGVAHFASDFERGDLCRDRETLGANSVYFDEVRSGPTLVSVARSEVRP